MDYINSSNSTTEILRYAQTIALPGGRESGNVKEYLATMDFTIPDLPGRCLHRGGRQ